MIVIHTDGTAMHMLGHILRELERRIEGSRAGAKHMRTIRDAKAAQARTHELTDLHRFLSDMMVIGPDDKILQSGHDAWSLEPRINGHPLSTPSQR